MVFFLLGLFLSYNSLLWTFIEFQLQGSNSQRLFDFFSYDLSEQKRAASTNKTRMLQSLWSFYREKEWIHCKKPKCFISEAFTGQFAQPFLFS